MLKTTIQTLEALYAVGTRYFKRSLSDHIHAHSQVDDFIGGDNLELTSCLEYIGHRQIVSEREYAQRCEMFQQKFASRFRYGEFIIGVIYEYNPQRTANELAVANQPIISACENLGIDLADFFKQREKCLEQYCAYERVYITLTTLPEALGAAKADAMAHRVQSNRDQPSLKEGQNPQRFFPELIPIHQSFVASVTANLEDAGIYVRPFATAQILREVRKMVEPSFTADSWVPALQGKGFGLRLPRWRTHDVSSLFAPPLYDQLFKSDGVHPNHSSVVIGDRAFATVIVNYPPLKPALFNDLRRNLRSIDRSIPWRASLTLNGGGQVSMWIKRLMAAMLVSIGDNKKIVDAYKAMDEQLQDGSACLMRMAFTTHAPADKKRLLERRLQTLAKEVEGWGQSQVEVERGDAAGGLASTLPAVSITHLGTPYVVPVHKAFYSLPLARAHSPWQQGNVCFRTPDGTMWFYQPASALQQVCIDVFIGVPGSGKTVTANHINLAYVLMPGTQRVPFVSLLDIDGGSKGTIDLLRRSVPASKKDQFLFHKMTLDDDYNPLGLLFGLKQPLRHEKDFVINLILLLTAPIDAEPYARMADLIEVVVAITYNKYADDLYAKAYEAGRNTEMDRALASQQIHVDQKSTWYELRDRLFDKGEIRLAEQAQRYAEPLLTDLLEAALDETIASRFNIQVAHTGETLIQAFSSALYSACARYACLTRPTQLHFGAARVVALDLDEVAPKGAKGLALRQTTVFYMVAAHLLISKFFLNQSLLKKIPEIYQAYHTQWIGDIEASSKRIFFDELHRCSKNSMLDALLTRYVLEGRRSKIHMGFASQFLRHFPEDVIDAATNVFIFNPGEEFDSVAARFKLRKVEQKILRENIVGPRADGCPLLHRYTTSEGRFTQWLKLSLPGEEMWFLSSSKDDRLLKARLEKTLGEAKALAVLARQFPSGSARNEIERRKKLNLLEDVNVIHELAEALSRHENTAVY